MGVGRPDGPRTARAHQVLMESSEGVKMLKNNNVEQVA